MVLLRNRVLGRNKIQDIWKAMPYKIIRRVDDENNVYEVKVADGQGKSKFVNRVDLLLCSEEDLLQSSEESSSDSDESELVGEIELFSEDSIPEPADDDTPEETEDVKAPRTPTTTKKKIISSKKKVTQPQRRSTRTTAGKNPNPHNLPRSVQQKAVKSEFTDFAKVICDLNSAAMNALINYCQLSGTK